MKIMRVIGYLVTAASFYYLARIALNLRPGFVFTGNPFVVLGDVATSFVFYGLFITVMSASWRIILEFFSNKRIPLRIAFTVYAKANIAKYLPGNVMHFAGRNVLGHKFGWSHSDIAASSLLEVAFMEVTAFFLAGIFMLWGVPVPRDLFSRISVKYLAIAVITVTVVFVAFFFAKVYQKKGDVRSLLSLDFLSLFMRIFPLYSFVFLGFGLILVGIFLAATNTVLSLSGVFTIVGVSVISWLTGFVVPGAPGGLGVRESMIVLLLSSEYGPENALTSALILRLVTLLGEVATFFFAVALDKKECVRARTSK